MNVDAILSDYNVFLTGASGFIGTVLLQRLLNVENSDDCKIFCLLRSGKKHATVTERLRNDILKNEILELSDNDINDIIVKERIIPIEGELTDELLGLDDKIISRLKYSHNTNNKKGIVIIHCAADIDFNRELNRSIHINVYGTFQCICVGNEINAKSFVHISTLYVNSRQHRDKNIKEKIYDSGLDFVAIFKKWLALKKQNQSFDATYLNKIRSITSKNDPLQRQEWPNSYTFTKNMAENVVTYYCGGAGHGHGSDTTSAAAFQVIPCSIIRLGIVSPIHRGKHLGWFMGNGGFVFLVIGIATGNIRYLNGDGKGRPDFVPVDYTCDVILSVAAHTTENTNGSHDGSMIYQCGVIANDKQWDVDNCVQYIRPRFIERDLPYCKENPNVTWIQSKTLFFAIESILYEIPLFLVGILSFLLSMFSMFFWRKLFYNVFVYKYENNANKLNKLTVAEQIRSLKMILYNKPYTFVKRSNFMKKARGKLNWFNSNYTYFVNQRWCFDHTNVKAMYSLLDDESQIKYDFDVDKISFNKYACESALVCFNKYINFKDKKKNRKGKIEQDIRNKLEVLSKEQEQVQEPIKQINNELTNDQKLQILQVVRKLFFMVGLDAKISFCIFIGMAMVVMFSFFGL